MWLIQWKDPFTWTQGACAAFAFSYSFCNLISAFIFNSSLFLILSFSIRCFLISFLINRCLKAICLLILFAYCPLIFLNSYESLSLSAFNFASFSALVFSYRSFCWIFFLCNSAYFCCIISWLVFFFSNRSSFFL